MNAAIDTSSSGRVCQVEQTQPRYPAARQRISETAPTAPTSAPRHRSAAARAKARASATCAEAIVGPRQPSLPESWDARSLDDDSISEELQKIKLNQRPLTRNLSTRRVRALRNSRLRARSTTSKADDSQQTLGVKEGKRLTAEEQALLCQKWQEWQKLQECVPAISGSQAEHRKDWAKAANVSVAELDRIEAEGPLAAHLILASTEGLLKSLCWRYVSRVKGVDIDDVMAEARSLFLDAAAQCDPSRASLISFGTMYVSQRLARILDKQYSLLGQPAGSLYDQLRVVRTRDELESELSREPSVQEIAKKARMTNINVQHVMQRLKSTRSIDSPIPGNAQDDESTTTADNLTGDASPESETNMAPIIRSEMEETLRCLMDKNIKNDNERKVCELYYGFDGQPSRPLRELGAMFDVSIETIRKRLIKARTHLNKNGELQKQMQPYLEEGLMTSEDTDSPSRITDLSAQTQNFDV